jgi:hypothetical protein
MTEGFLRGAENYVLFLDKSTLLMRLHTIILCFCSNRDKKKSLGDLSDGGTPGYISNPVVKPVSADGTWSADSRESRSLPRDFFFIFPQGSIVQLPVDLEVWME